MKLHTDQYQLDYDATTGKSPCVIFCPGFNSTKEGDKVLAIEAFCSKHGQAFIRFDYSGHGESAGDFANGNISQWLGDTLAIIDKIAKDGVILIGSSMGGWIALLAALLRPKKVLGLMLLACATDMTKYYTDQLRDLQPQKDPQGRTYYRVSNSCDDQQGYSIYQNLIDDGAKHFLLGKPIELSIPVRFVHGLQDDIVPWQRSKATLDAISSVDASLHLIEPGDHRLSSPNNIDQIIYLLDRLL